MSIKNQTIYTLLSKTITVVLVATIIFSCEKEVDIPIEKTEAKLVVNAIFNTDSLWNAEISTSKYIYDGDDFNLLDDAQVTIMSSSGNQVTLSNQGNGVYRSATEKPQIGETYNINVYHNDYGSVNASNSLPGTINISEIGWGETTYLAGIRQRRIRITFTDPPNENYYLIKLNTKHQTEYFMDPATYIIDSISISYPIYFSTQNPIIDDSQKESWSSSLTFKDNLFNGTEYTIDLLIEDYMMYDEKERADSEEDYEDVVISMSSISKEYYLYQTSYQSYLATQSGFFSQPTQVYTNIVDGLGVFAGFSTNVDTLIFE